MPAAAAIEKSRTSHICSVAESSAEAAGIKKIHRAPQIGGAPRPSLWELARPRNSSPARSDIARPRPKISVPKNFPKNHDRAMSP
jgi:hypothetical protein